MHSQLFSCKLCKTGNMTTKASHNESFATVTAREQSTERRSIGLVFTLFSLFQKPPNCYKRPSGALEGPVIDRGRGLYVTANDTGVFIMQLRHHFINCFQNNRLLSDPFNLKTTV